MKKILLKQIDRVYKNNGQHAEQVARYTLTGEIVKADNKPFTAGGDVGDIQIKGNRATVCKGNDIDKHLAADGANRYGYVTEDFRTMVLMDKDEYRTFVETFASEDRESHKNGGGLKLRLRRENDTMRGWLGL